MSENLCALSLKCETKEILVICFQNVQLTGKTATWEFWEVTQFCELFIGVVKQAITLMYWYLVGGFWKFIQRVNASYWTCTKVHVATSLTKVLVRPSFVESAFILSTRKIDSCRHVWNEIYRNCWGTVFCKVKEKYVPTQSMIIILCHLPFFSGIYVVHPFRSGQQMQLLWAVWSRYT